MRSLPLRVLILLCIVCLPCVLRAQIAPRARWIALVPGATAGAPVQMQVTKAGKQTTTLEIHLTGFWLNTRTYAGRTFSEITLPEARLGGLGFPQRAGERGWYDFPAETRQSILPSDRYTLALEHSVPKPMFPQKALGQTPRTERDMLALGVNPAGARPGIPALRGYVAVSRRNKDADLALTIRSEQMAAVRLESPLLPAGFQGSDQSVAREGYTPPELVDEEFYSTFKGDYRGTEQTLSRIEGAGVFSQAQFRMPLISVQDPHAIRVVTNLVVELKHLAGVEDFECALAWDTWYFKNGFVNGIALLESVTAKGLKIEASRSAHYLILTPHAYRSELDEFAEWKQSKGLNVDFAYVGNSASDDVLPERNAIDAYVEAYFHEHYCHGVYVLLVGDTDVIPTGRSSLIQADPDGSDGDSDHVYEVLGSDRTPSLYVGRLSVNSVEELKNQLTKILSYERNPPAGNWPTRAILAANSENDDKTRGVSASFPSKYAAAVNAIAAYPSYVSPPVFQVYHAGASTIWTKRAVNQDILDEITDGCGQVLYRGHGDGDSWAAGWDGSSVNGASWLRSAQIPLLQNNIYPIVYSIACQNGRIRNNECLAEAWMSRVGGGAVAHWGASVNSATGENHERAKGVFRAICANGFTRLGPALAEAELFSLNATGGNSEWDNNTFCYILLGDPEMTIRKRPVNSFVPIVTIAQQDLGSLLSVEDPAGARVPGAFINIEFQGDRTTNGFTGDNGTLLLPGVTRDQITRFQVHADGFAAEVVAVKSQAPRLVALGYDPTGRFRLRVLGDPGEYQVWGSPNLGQWTNLGTVPIAFKSTEFADLPRRNALFYYRVSRLP